jgi:hypothetical protein
MQSRNRSSSTAIFSPTTPAHLPTKTSACAHSAPENDPGKKWKMPKISYTVQDPESAGAKAFMKYFPNIHEALVGRVEEVNALLYGSVFPLEWWGPDKWVFLFLDAEF